MGTNGVAGVARACAHKFVAYRICRLSTDCNQRGRKRHVTNLRFTALAVHEPSSVRPVIADDAWQEVYVANAKSLLRLAAIVAGTDDAPDVVADAMLRVVQSRSFAKATDKRAYLHRAVINEAHRRRLRRSRRLLREQRAQSLEPTGRSSEFPEGSQAAGGADGTDPIDERMICAFRLLSKQQRAVLYLAYWEDLAPALVAERLGISEGSVRRQLARGRARLRKVLEHD